MSKINHFITEMSKINPFIKTKPASADYTEWAALADKNETIANTDTKLPAGYAAWAKLPLPTSGTTASQTGNSHKYSWWAPAQTEEAKKQNALKSLTGGGVQQKQAVNYTPWLGAAQYSGAAVPTAGPEEIVDGSEVGEGSESGSPGSAVEEAVNSDEGFAQWLKADPAYQEALKKAQGDYDRALATYGARGEALAQSGLVGSGYSDWLGAQAYADMQEQKQTAFDKGYSQWLGEKEKAELEAKAEEEKLKIEQADVVNHLINNGISTDTDLENAAAYLKTQGYSDASIQYMRDYYTSQKEQAKTNASNAMKQFETDGDVAAFVAGLGYTMPEANEDGSALSEEQIATYSMNAVEQAVKDGKISREEASAHYKLHDIFDPDDIAGKSLEDANDTIYKVVRTAEAHKDKMTEADYKEVIKSAYDALGSPEIVVGKQGNKFREVVFRVNVNGKTVMYTADITGESRASTETEYKLNEAYGNATLALYNGKVYYQYGDDKWVEIGTKAGSPGSKSEGNNALRVVAAYYGENQIFTDKRYSRTIINMEGLQYADDIEKIISRYQGGEISLDEAAKQAWKSDDDYNKDEWRCFIEFLSNSK